MMRTLEPSMYHPLSIFHLPTLPSPSLFSYASSSAFPLLFGATLFRRSFVAEHIFEWYTTLRHSRILSLSSLPRNSYIHKAIQNSAIRWSEFSGWVRGMSRFAFFPITKVFEKMSSYFSIDYVNAWTNHIGILKSEGKILTYCNKNICFFNDS